MAVRPAKRDAIFVHVELQFARGWRRLPGEFTNLGETAAASTPRPPIIYPSGAEEPQSAAPTPATVTIDANIVPTASLLRELATYAGTTGTIQGRLRLEERPIPGGGPIDDTTIAFAANTGVATLAGDGQHPKVAYDAAVVKLADGSYLEVDEINREAGVKEGTVKSVVRAANAAAIAATAYSVVQGAGLYGTEAGTPFSVNEVPGTGSVVLGENAVFTGRYVLSPTATGVNRPSWALAQPA